MSRGIQAFKQTDVSKAIRGAQNAGLVVDRFEIDKAGKIIVIAAPLKQSRETGRADT